ncbi:MAG: response regulator [Anaerolineales bacterium]|nr:response regulator [Anaerolineales bacterium]
MSKSENILIIDDDPSTTRLLEVLLSREGYNIQSENLGENAIQTSKSFAPNLIILDLMMPGVDGMTICRDMKGDPELEDIPIIMFTAVNQPEVKAEATEAGINEYITKPIHPNDLKDRIRRWLESGAS